MNNEINDEINELANKYTDAKKNGKSTKYIEMCLFTLIKQVCNNFAKKYINRKEEREDVVQELWMLSYKLLIDRDPSKGIFSHLLLKALQRKAVICSCSINNGKNKIINNRVNIDQLFNIDNKKEDISKVFGDKELVQRLKAQVDDPTTLQIIDLIMANTSIKDICKHLNISTFPYYNIIHKLKAVVQGLNEGRLIRIPCKPKYEKMSKEYRRAHQKKYYEKNRRCIIDHITAYNKCHAEAYKKYQKEYRRTHQARKK